MTSPFKSAGNQHGSERRSGKLPTLPTASRNAGLEISSGGFLQTGLVMLVVTDLCRPDRDSSGLRQRVLEFESRMTK